MGFQMTKEIALTLFNYDKKSGKIYWKTARFNKQYLIGREAGTISNGYKVFKYSGKMHKVHRVIFLIEMGYFPKVIDHINGNTLDNRFVNLRESTSRANAQNLKIHREGKKLGAFTVNGKTWTANTNFNKKNVHLGTFNTEAEAHAAYVGADVIIKRILENGVK